MASTTLKRGDTFERILALPDDIADGYFVGWNIDSEVRKESGGLVDTLVATWLDEPTRKTIKLFKLDTSGWPTGRLFFDVQFTRISDDYVRSTETVTLNVVRDQTIPSVTP